MNHLEKSVTMVLDNLGNSLRKTLKKIANSPHIDREVIKEVTRDIQRALVMADVNVRMVRDLTKRIEERALEEKPKPGVSSREHVIRIVSEELVHILGGARDVPLKRMRIMMVGLYGQGKTTTTGKLARYFQRKGMRVALIAADVHRPAAIDQLRQLGTQVNSPVYYEYEENDAVKVVMAGLEKFKNEEIVIIDTAGRHALEDDLIDEIERIHLAAEPDEKFLVLDAAVGQQAGPQAQAFHDAVNVTGVIITKLDGTAKGGGALSAVQATHAPIVFIGTGEHVEDLEHFDPPRFISRILGGGDIKALLEKATEAMEEGDAEELARNIMGGKFTLKDMYKQMEMIGKMGKWDKIVDLLPFGGSIKNSPQFEAQQEKLFQFRVIMDSMTDEEQENPRIIKSQRIHRIARGAGVQTSDVRQLLKQYDMSMKTVKGIVKNRKKKKQLMRQFGGDEDFMQNFMDQGS
jgi:signal recognition particle subunit SRP54